MTYNALNGIDTLNTPQEAIYDWLDHAIGGDCKIMTAPAKEGQIHIARKIAGYKQYLAEQGPAMELTSYLLKDLPCPTANELNDVGHHYSKQQLFLRALLEVKTGAYRMTKDEYEALTYEGDLHHHGEVKCYSLYHQKNILPLDALKKTSFEEFQRIRQQVLFDRKLPIELPPELTVNKGSVALDNTVNEQPAKHVGKK